MILWKALLAQLAGMGVAVSLLRLFPGTMEAVLPLAVAQGTVAALTGWVLQAPGWWVPIHLLFAPGLVLAGRLDLPSWPYLAAFISMLLVYWRTFGGEPPLYLTNRETARAAAALLPGVGGLRVADLGAGIGGVLTELARARPDVHCVGIEHAPLPYLIGRLRCARLPNCRFLLGDFWSHPLAGMDVVYVFLSPAVMERLWQKASCEMSAGAMLISSRFAVPGIAPERVVPTDGTGRHALYCYRIGAGSGIAG